MVLTESVTAPGDPLTDVVTLARRLSSGARPTVIDVRWRLGGPSGQDDYESAHIPGSVFLDLDADLCGSPGARGRHPLPHPDELQAVLRRAGVREGHPVVVYDGGDGFAASRTWWTLRWAGVDAVQVLDGGFDAWVAAGQPVTADKTEIPPGDVVVRPGGLPVLDADGAAELARNGVLVDARAAERYRAEPARGARGAGHRPGAVNTRAAVRPAGRGGRSCGSGVGAARTVLALHRAGRTDAALYVGSWSEWITDPARPIATGPNP